MQATKFETYYVAANEDDERGKEDIWLTLNRNEKWNCSTLKGSSSCYEFAAEPRDNHDEHIVYMRTLPCPCANCRVRNYGACTNIAIVGHMTAHVMTAAADVDCPDVLNAPLTDYTVPVLRAFITLHQGNVPAEATTKPRLIRHITDALAEFVVDRIADE